VDIVSFCGWAGAVCFTLCGLPQAITCVKTGNGVGLSRAFLWLWLFGEIFMLVYAIYQLKMDGPLMLNLIMNIFFVLIIMRYVYFPRKTA